MDINSIAKAFGTEIAADVSAFCSDRLNTWRGVYENSPPWQNTKKGGLFSHGSRQLLRLNMAKTLCDSLSAMTFAEQCDIAVSGGEQQLLSDILEQNSFWDRLPELLSTVYALGGGAMKAYLDNGEVRIDYIPADRFVPVRWDGRRITEAVFISVTARDKDIYTLLEHQFRGGARFRLYKSASDRELGREVPLAELFPELPQTVSYDTDIPMFAYIRPAVSNNTRYCTPLGMSVYADCLDTLKSLDTVFDSLVREFVLGKKRIIVPDGCIRTVIDPESGEPKRYFDADDEAFVALRTEDRESLKITDSTTELRVEEHVAAINALLNILCMQTGLSAGTFSFDVQQGVKTATEIIAQESKSARTVRTNKNLLTEAIEDIVHAALFLATERECEAVTVSWRDNIVEDINTVADRAIKLYSAGLISRQKALMDIYGIDEAAALAMSEQISRESDIGGTGLDMFGKGE
ncbi:MAG: phage portal protein [Oscillospiraceae bacterium]|nr:phage portal protein [Oscillospiraceae bacterium]